ncbi:unnamed protein product [Rotaria socialis]|uniref:Uncharacterized protein n=1 Tax=Rotaria socialis TaxID=392032 RepID=A0A820K4B7_9BILA|nr:unnamed protein product [Rotaria socialis]CAF3584278.1 unnamed protein product [Rotaria socialis]CAF4335700.1 unnamed protein product [Rotaria socialis]CAF4725508.1 unnamed protein product [Rotaria socialis]
MTSTESTSETNSKKRRIMIITADESIIEQFQSSGNVTLFKSIVLDANGNNIDISHSNMNGVLHEGQTSTNRKAKNGTLTCVVCGSTANGYNFDAISCESCKAFFRRNALKDLETVECRRNGDCDVTLESRRRCSACRLAKCLKSGMKRDRLLTAEQKAVKRRKIEENRIQTLKVTENNQNLISEIKQQKSQPLASPAVTTSSETSGTNLLLLKDYTDLLPQKKTDGSRQLLSYEELQRVQTIQLSFEQRIELAARDGLPWNPSIHTSTLLQHLNARSVSAMRLLSFFKQIPEFNDLAVQDKVTLIKYNLMPLFILNCTLGYNSETEKIIEADFDAPWDSTILAQVHGQDIYMRVKKIFESFVRIAQYDPRIIQLALIVLILTKGFSATSDSTEPCLDDGMAVYRAQNYYTELLWKYLETIHGYGKAVHIFNELVAHFTSWQMLQYYLHSDLHNVLSPTEMNELLPIMKSLLHIP